MSENYVFNEHKYLDELGEYLKQTYKSHYSQNKFQTTEFIIDCDHGLGFAFGNIIKYVQRYGKKGTPADHRKDIMKIMHYAILALYNHDLNNGENDNENK